MTNNNLKRVNDKTVKAVKDKTDWAKVYAQGDAEIQQNSLADPDAGFLNNAVYKKAVKL